MSYLALAPIALILCCQTTAVVAQESLTLKNKYDLGTNRYSEGLDFYGNYLWHTTGYTTGGTLHQLDLASATDTDGDGDYDLQADRTWILTHSNYSESSVWLDDELFNFTFRDSTGNLNTIIFKLDLNDNESYQYQAIGFGLSTTNWGSCRDGRNPGETIIYTGHYDNLLMWFNPDNGLTTKTVNVTSLDWIEDLGMDRYGTLWASSYHSDYPGLYRIDPDTGEVLATYMGPEGLSIIDGIAIRTSLDHDVMYITGKNTRYIWEYIVPEVVTGVDSDLAAATVELHSNYPNPFNPTTTIFFNLPQALQVHLDVYSLDGRHVHSLVNDVFGVGAHSATWDGTDEYGRAVASGTYFCRLVAGQFVKCKRMVLVR